MSQTTEDRVVRLTSPGHLAALALYLAGAFGGLITMLGLAEAKSMTDMVGIDFVQVWGGVTFVAGLLVASVAVIARFDLPSRSRLAIECMALAVLFLCWLWYEITLVYGNGFDKVLFTQNFVTWAFIGYVARAVEIPFEIRRVRVEPKVGE